MLGVLLGTKSSPKGFVNLAAFQYFGNLHGHQVGLKGLQGFEFSHYSAAKGEKPSPICVSAILGKID